MRSLAEGRTVIVCDSDEATLSSFCNHLGRMGIDRDNLICTSSIKETMDILHSIPTIDPDLIFIDINMKESGYSLCSLLDMTNKLYNIPVLLMSYPEQGIGPMRGVAMRGRGFIPKPVQLLTLQNKLIKIFREVDLERRLSTVDKSLNCYSNNILQLVEQNGR